MVVMVGGIMVVMVGGIMVVMVGGGVMMVVVAVLARVVVVATTLPPSATDWASTSLVLHCLRPSSCPGGRRNRSRLRAGAGRAQPGPAATSRRRSPSARASSRRRRRSRCSITPTTLGDAPHLTIPLRPFPTRATGPPRGGRMQNTRCLCCTTRRRSRARDRRTIGADVDE